MIGMNATTGRAVHGLAHLSQSIGKICTTPRGSRLQRRTFGSNLFTLVDAPHNQANRIKVYAEIATSLMRQEPRLQLRRVALSAVSQDGTAVFDIEGLVTETGEAIATSVALPAGSAA